MQGIIGMYWLYEVEVALTRPSIAATSVADNAGARKNSFNNPCPLAPRSDKKLFDAAQDGRVVGVVNHAATKSTFRMIVG